MKDSSKEQYQKLIDIQIKNNRVFSELINGSRKKLYIGDKLIGSSVEGFVDLNELTSAQFASFLATFTRNLYSNIRKYNLIDFRVNFNGISRSKNKSNFNSLQNSEFYYNVDLKSAYWQIAYRLNYISENLYTKYINEDKYKSVKRLCISFLARPNKKNYYSDGIVKTIHCDTSVLQRVYDNIRKELYRLIHNITIQVDYIEYNIDGISVKSSDLDKVKDYFNQENLKFKINLLQKIDSKNYLQSNKIRKF